MNIVQKSPGSTAINQQSPENQVNLFLFDLQNEAKEHGFKQNETWTLELASEHEIARLKRFHHPVVSLRLQSSALLEIYKSVKGRLKQALSTADVALTDSDLINNNKMHLAAYPARSIR